MQDKYLNLPQEYTNLIRTFQSPNIPEFNRRLRVSFFLYHIQSEHRKDWDALQIPLRFITIDDLTKLIREHRLPENYSEIRLINEMIGFIDDFKENGAKSQGFIDIVPLRLPTHPKFWKSYLDDASSTELLEIFKTLIDASEQELRRQQNFEDSVRLKKSLEKYNKN